MHFSSVRMHEFATFFKGKHHLSQSRFAVSIVRVGCAGKKAAWKMLCDENVMCMHTTSIFRKKESSK